MVARLGIYVGQLHSPVALNDTEWGSKYSLLPNTISGSIGEDNQVSVHDMQGIRVVNQPTLRLEQLGLAEDGWVGAVVPLGAEDASLSSL